MSIDGQILMTKTQHYRKITKPLLERKRRVRINSYLDELKVLIIDALEEHGEHINKLEKADILEMTVNYLKMMTKQTKNSIKKAEFKTVEIYNSISLEQFRNGFSQATYDISKVLYNMPDYKIEFVTQLLQHLNGQLKNMKDLKYQWKGISSVKYARSGTLQLNDIKVHQPNESNNIWRPW